MTTGTDARLDRIGTDGNYVIVPMDHGITIGAVQGLKDIESTIDGITRGGADAVLTQKGIAPRVHENKNGKGYIVHLNGSTSIGPDENDKRPTGTVEDAIRVGADAVSFHINVGSDHEPDQLSQLAEVTSTADRFGIPVLAMAYARGPGIDSEDPEALGHAVRLAEELGADIVKTGYSGDADSFQHVVDSTDCQSSSPAALAAPTARRLRWFAARWTPAVRASRWAGRSSSTKTPRRFRQPSPASSTTTSPSMRRFAKLDSHSRLKLLAAEWSRPQHTHLFTSFLES